MKIHQTNFSEVLLIEPRKFEDNRGFFYESFNAKRYAENGMTKTFVQDNISRSFRHVVRGLHYQLQQPQGKLVSVIRGKVFDVAVDIRKESPTFSQWFGVVLSDENHLQMYIPEGFAHGFCVLSEYADFMYKCTDYYCPQGEGGLFWNDPLLNIQWPLPLEAAILNPKDLANPCLNAISKDKLPSYRL